MLEIGSYEGRSTVWFLENILTEQGAEITCVDVFSEPRWELRFDHNIRVSGLGGKVRKLKGRSEDLLPELPRASYDIIYVDGSHEAGAVLMDALLSWTLLKPGGLLLFDDYRWEPEKKSSQRPQMAIDLFLESFAGRFELVHQDYQVVIRKKPSSPPL
jgi:predicted O-methyltransferase YrrM